MEKEAKLPQTEGLRSQLKRIGKEAPDIVVFFGSGPRKTSALMVNILPLLVHRSS